MGITEGTLIASFLFIPPRSEVVGCASLRGRIGGCQGSLWLLLQSLALSGPQSSVIPWDNYCHHKSRQTLPGIVPANKEGLCGGVKGLGQMQPTAVPDFVAVFLARQSHSCTLRPGAFQRAEQCARRKREWDLWCLPRCGAKGGAS